MKFCPSTNCKYRITYEIIGIFTLIQTRTNYNTQQLSSIVYDKLPRVTNFQICDLVRNPIRISILDKVE